MRGPPPPPLASIHRYRKTTVPLFDLTYSPSTYVAVVARRTVAADILLVDLVARTAALEADLALEADRAHTAAHIAVEAELVRIDRVEELRIVLEVAARSPAALRTVVVVVVVRSRRPEVRAAWLRRSSTPSRPWCRS